MTNDAPAYVKHLIAQGEDEKVELMARPDAGEVGRTVCAFLNGDGGTIVIGVDEKGTIRGVADADAAIQLLREALQTGLVPTAPWSLTAVDLGRKRVVLIDVPHGPRVPYVWDNTIVIRSGRNNQIAKGNEISRLIDARGRSGERWERQPALGADMNHLDLDQIEQLRETAETRQLRRFRGSGVEHVLDDLGLLAGGQLRNSAMVLFGVDPARWYPQTRLHLAAFSGSATSSRFVDNRVVDGHAFALFEEALQFVTRHVPISAEIPASSTVREDKPAYPLAALREAILNAIVHRDYASFDGGTWIAVFSDRIEITNSGSLPSGMTAEDLKRGFISRPVNPDMAYVFFLRGLVEYWGLGTRKILDECLAAGLPEPTWEVAAGRVRLRIASAASPAETADAEVLNERQLRFLRALPEKAIIGVRDYVAEYASDVSDRQARNDLNALVRQGYLSRIGGGNRTAYRRTAKRLRER